jgi:hypothetical protein
MHPTTTVPPLRSTVSTPVPAPGTVVALRVLAWLQIAVAAAFGLVGVWIAAISSAGLGAGGETAAWASLGVALGLVWAGVCATVVTAVLIPTVLLRRGRPGALVSLAVVEAAFAVLTLGGAVTAIGSTGAASGLLALCVAAVCATVAVLALQPSSRAWAARPTTLSC